MELICFVTRFINLWGYSSDRSGSHSKIIKFNVTKQKPLVCVNILKKGVFAYVS